MTNPYMMEAIRLSQEVIKHGDGGPFGAVIVKDEQIIGRGYNQVPDNCDPTAHAEIVAIRHACQHLNDFSLAGCTLYASCEPCPMCMAAIYWARIDNVYYANLSCDAQAIGFDDALIYGELAKEPRDRVIPMENIMREQAQSAFATWMQKVDKISY